MKRENFNIIQSFFISDDDEVAKKEIEQLYFLGFFNTCNVHCGSEPNMSWIIESIFFSIVSFLVTIIHILTTIFLSFPLMILVTYVNSDHMQSIGLYIQDLVINKILLNGGEKSVASIILVVCTICSLLITVIRCFKLKPLKVFKNLIVIVCMSITIGTFMQNTIAFHKILEKAIQQPLDSLITCNKTDTTIQQKSLVFKIFQEQPFLIRHFGVNKVKDIRNLGNYPGDKASEREEIESADTQYERLLLGYPEGKEKFGTENYAIHQALEPKNDIFQDKATKNGCNNSCIKKSGRFVEVNLLFYSLFSTVFMIPTFVIMFILLIILFFITFIGYLKPITSFFSCFKCILEANFKMFFNVLFNTISWLLFLPIIKIILQYVILVVMNTISFSQSGGHIFALCSSILISYSIYLAIKHFKTYSKYFGDIAKSIRRFSLDSIKPDSNAFHSANNILIQPAFSGAKGKINEFLHNDLPDDFDIRNPLRGDQDIIGLGYQKVTNGFTRSVNSISHLIKRRNNKDTKDDLIQSNEKDSSISRIDNDKTDAISENIEIVSNNKDKEDITSHKNKQNNEDNIHDCNNYIDIENSIESNNSKEINTNIKNNTSDKEEELEYYNQKDLSNLIEKDNPNNKKINNVKLQNNNKNISIISTSNKPIISNEEKEKIKMDIFNCEELPTQNKDFEFVMSKKMIYAQRRLSRRIYRKKIISKKDKKK